MRLTVVVLEHLVRITASHSYTRLLIHDFSIGIPQLVASGFGGRNALRIRDEAEHLSYAGLAAHDASVEHLKRDVEKDDQAKPRNPWVARQQLHNQRGGEGHEQNGQAQADDEFGLVAIGNRCNC